MDIRASENRLTIHGNGGNTGFGESLMDEVRQGLAGGQKSLPSKLFYDHEGSRLFEQICRLPEYYLTRTEMSILRREAASMVAGFPEGDVVELGSGSNWKVKPLLDAAFATGTRVRYVPIDVSKSAMIESSRELIALYPALTVEGLVTDFTGSLHGIPSGRPKLILFLGSTIGNFAPSQRVKMLGALASLMTGTDRLLLGADMVKPELILHRAYNDGEGITARFNMNMLNVLNREGQGDFNPGDFDHLAFYRREEERVEMHLRARKDLSAHLAVPDLNIEMMRDETIHTEISCKFTTARIEEETHRAGLTVTRWFGDGNRWFSVIELARSG